MRNMGGEKTLNIRIPYDIYCKLDKFVKENSLTKTSLIVDMLNDLFEETDEMRELGILSEREQLIESLKQVKEGKLVSLDDI